jgi:hypothetical protein
VNFFGTAGSSVNPIPLKSTATAPGLYSSIMSGVSPFTTTADTLRASTSFNRTCDCVVLTVHGRETVLNF